MLHKECRSIEYIVSKFVHKKKKANAAIVTINEDDVIFVDITTHEQLVIARVRELVSWRVDETGSLPSLTIKATSATGKLVSYTFSTLQAREVAGVLSRLEACQLTASGRGHRADGLSSHLAGLSLLPAIQ